VENFLQGFVRTQSDIAPGNFIRPLKTRQSGKDARAQGVGHTGGGLDRPDFEFPRDVQRMFHFRPDGEGAGRHDDSSKAAPDSIGKRFAFAATTKRLISPRRTPMKTITITEAKKHLRALLKDALDGQNIGIICGNRVVALRPVEVTSLDFEKVGDPEVVGKLTVEQREQLYERLKKERKEAKRRRKELLAAVPQT
ncbi:MAG: hypothetical protein RIQ71_1882, partial [Verrucomicrobiota bacterium]|jgi:antitoxin (DNA-binding transcriptional repressor) of toxin-antitoxin stability system